MSSALTNGLKGKRGYEELMSVPCECCAASVVAIVWNLESEERRRIIWAVDGIKRVKSRYYFEEYHWKECVRIVCPRMIQSLVSWKLSICSICASPGWIYTRGCQE
jgi:hypothetical protein